MARRRWVATATIVFTLTSAVSCSFSPFQNRKVTIQLPPELRDGPALGAMSHYALMASEGPANSLSSADVGRRSVACLGFAGSVYFPYSFADIQAGVSIALPLGTYHFKIVGFSGAGIPSPTSVAQLFSASPALKAYVLAEGSKNTAGGGTASLAASYNATTAVDLVGACPPSNQSLHAAVYRNGVQVVYLKASSNGSSWDNTVVQGTYDTSAANLEVDGNGAAHVFYSNPGTSLGIRYAQNTSGTFVDAQAISASITQSYSEHAVLFDGSGSLKVVTNRNVSGLNHGAIFEKVINTFTNPVDAYTVNGAFFKEMNLALAPNGNILLSGVEQTGVSPIRVAQYVASTGTWASAPNLTSAGAATCTALGQPAAAYNSQARSHVAFLCDTASATLVAYANNVSGSWASSSAGTFSNSNHVAPAIAIEHDHLHLVWGDGSNVKYVSGDAAAGTLNGATVVATMTGTISQVQLLANSPNDIKAVVTVSNSGNTDLYYVWFNGTSWNQREVFAFVGSATLARGFFQR